MAKKFDVTEYLESPEDIAGYMTEALATRDPEFIMIALDDVFKAKGITQVAALADLNRVSLRRAVRERADVRISTIAGIADALGCRLAFIPKDKAVA